jgi:hypothetical protein
VFCKYFMDCLISFYIFYRNFPCQIQNAQYETVWTETNRYDYYALPFHYRLLKVLSHNILCIR